MMRHCSRLFDWGEGNIWRPTLDLGTFFLLRLQCVVVVRLYLNTMILPPNNLRNALAFYCRRRLPLMFNVSIIIFTLYFVCNAFFFKPSRLWNRFVQRRSTDSSLLIHGFVGNYNVLNSFDVCVQSKNSCRHRRRSTDSSLLIHFSVWLCWQLCWSGLTSDSHEWYRCDWQL